MIAANGNRTHRRRIIDFTSNPPNMTTVTCQRSRIVSPTGIVPIRRYIFVAFRDFFPKTAGRRTASENDQATITCGPFARRKTGKDDVDAATTDDREGDLLSIFCHLLGFTTSHRVSTLPGTYQHVTLVYPPTGQPARAHRRVFVCRRERRPDAAWISWKSGAVQHATSIYPCSTCGKIKTYRLCIEILCIFPVCLKIYF